MSSYNFFALILLTALIYRCDLNQKLDANEKIKIEKGQVTDKFTYDYTFGENCVRLLKRSKDRKYVFCFPVINSSKNSIILNKVSIKIPDRNDGYLNDSCIKAFNSVYIPKEDSTIVYRTVCLDTNYFFTQNELITFQVIFSDNEGVFTSNINLPLCITSID